MLLIGADNLVARYEIDDRSTVCDVTPRTLSVTVTGSLVNRSNYQQSFRITVDITAPDGSPIDRVQADTPRLKPGDSGSWNATAFRNPKRSTTATCKVADVVGVG